MIMPAINTSRSNTTYNFNTGESEYTKPTSPVTSWRTDSDDSDDNESNEIIPAW